MRKMESWQPCGQGGSDGVDKHTKEVGGKRRVEARGKERLEGRAMLESETLFSNSLMVLTLILHLQGVKPLLFQRFKGSTHHYDFAAVIFLSAHDSSHELYGGRKSRKWQK